MGHSVGVRCANGFIHFVRLVLGLGFYGMMRANWGYSLLMLVLL